MKKFFTLSVFCLLLQTIGYSQHILDTLLTLNFENGADSIISFHHVNGTPWQTGPPQKTLLDSAYTPANAIITDTASPYLPNTYTYFEVPFVPSDYGAFGASSFVCPLVMCFEHQSDWDSAHAGGWMSIRDNDDYITYFDLSLQCSLNSSSYFYYSIYMIEELDSSSSILYSYDTLFNDTLGFKISDAAWTKTCLNMYWVAVAPPRSTDTIFFRFSFQSDSTMNPNREGWMIDEIQFGHGGGICGGGSIEENSGSKIFIYPNPAWDLVYITTMGIFEKGSYQIVNTQGQIVQEHNLNYAEQIPVLVENIPPGIYVIKFRLDNKFYTKRLLKE